MNRDITRSKESLETLQQSESMLRQLYDALPVMVGVIASLADDILYLAVDDRSTQFMGTTAGNVRGRLASELGVPPRHIQSWLEHLRESKRLRHPVQFEYAHKKPDGIDWLAVTVNHIGTGTDSLPRFTYLAQIITQRKWMEEEFATRFWQLQSFHNISQTILNSTDLKSTLDAILAEILARGAYDTGAIYLVRPAIHGIEAVAWKGYRDPENLQRNPSRAVSHSIQQEKIRVLEDVSEPDGYSRLNREGVRSAVSLPICAGSVVLGIFEVGRRIASKLQLDDIRLLENISNLIGIAIQKAMFHENSERHHNQVQVLYETEKAMTSALDLQSVLDNLLAEIASLLPYSATRLSLWDPTLGELKPVAFHNLNGEEWLRSWPKRRKSLSWTVFQSQSPLVVRNLQTDSRIKEPEAAANTGWFPI